MFGPKAEKVNEDGKRGVFIQRRCLLLLFIVDMNKYMSMDHTGQAKTKVLRETRAQCRSVHYKCWIY